jgi:hypothetical protein
MFFIEGQDFPYVYICVTLNPDEQGLNFYLKLFLKV